MTNHSLNSSLKNPSNPKKTPQQQQQQKHQKKTFPQKLSLPKMPLFKVHLAPRKSRKGSMGSEESSPVQLVHWAAPLPDVEPRSWIYWSLRAAIWGQRTSPHPYLAWKMNFGRKLFFCYVFLGVIETNSEWMQMKGVFWRWKTLSGIYSRFWI